MACQDKREQHQGKDFLFTRVIGPNPRMEPTSRRLSSGLRLAAHPPPRWCRSSLLLTNPASWRSRVSSPHHTTSAPPG